MTKATRVINKYHIKEMLLNGDPQFENFYKEELIQFCEVARELLKENKKCKEVIDKLKNQPTVYLTKYLSDLGFVETKTLNELIEELENDILKEV